MNPLLYKLPVTLALLVLMAGCASGVNGGNSGLPRSNARGTTRIFTASEEQIVSAVQKAFADYRYRGMWLHTDAESGDVLPSTSMKNGFVLRNGHEPMANIPLRHEDGTRVPYLAYFHISFAPTTGRQTQVTVQTILSQVIDGKESVNFHGGTANHYRRVSPVRCEEESVLAAIGEQLKSIHQ